MDSLITPAGYEVEADCECGLNGYRLDPIPDSILGISIKEACCIHDWMYGKGITAADRAQADKYFLENVLFIIRRDSRSSILAWFRRRIAYGYYDGLRGPIGGAVFWRHKHPSEDAVANRSA